MKVLFVNINDSSGGASRAAMRIMSGVQQIGVDAQMFVKYKYLRSDDVLSIQQFVPSNQIYKAFDWVWTKIRNKWQYYKWLPYKNTKKEAYLSDLRSMSCHGALQKLDYDIAHVHWINMRFLDIRELAKIHKPIVWTLHDSWPFCSVCHVPYDCEKYQTHCGACPMLGSKKEKDLAYEVFKKKQIAYQGVDLHIVTPSRWLAECAKKSALFGQFPITIIPNCIDAEVYQPMNKQEIADVFGLKPDKKYLLFGAMHATTDKNKGFELLIDALQQLKVKDKELIVYGTDEDLSKYDIPMPVHSLGYIRGDKQMAMLYNAADVVAVPSKSENLSNTIMESLSCETPVVAFNIGGNGDMIDHKQNGYLAQEYDSADMARGIEWCLNHNEGNVLGRNARQKVLDNYTIEIVSKQYKELYSMICK